MIVKPGYTYVKNSGFTLLTNPNNHSFTSTKENRMGSFGGHALPGSFFIVFALWYTFNIFRKYYICRQRNQQFTSCISYPASFLCGRLKHFPLDGCFKIVVVACGFFGEIYTGSHHGQFHSVGNGQHATMFFFFGMTGIMDILVHFRAPLPPGIDYVCNILAFCVEGLIFKFHLHGRTDLSVQLHTFLLYTIYATVFLLLVEMRFRNNVMPALIRSYLFLLQGTWFFQLGFILYHPFPSSKIWDEEDHEEMMLATLYFTWHVGVVFVFMLLVGSIFACVYRKRWRLEDNDDVTMVRLIQSEANGKALLTRDDASDSEEDFEFEKAVIK